MIVMLELIQNFLSQRLSWHCWLRLSGRGGRDGVTLDGFSGVLRLLQPRTRAVEGTCSDATRADQAGWVTGVQRPGTPGCDGSLSDELWMIAYACSRPERNTAVSFRKQVGSSERKRERWCVKAWRKENIILRIFKGCSMLLITTEKYFNLFVSLYKQVKLWQ